MDNVLNLCESWLINLPFLPQVLILAIIVGSCAIIIAYYGNKVLFRTLDVIIDSDHYVAEKPQKSIQENISMEEIHSLISQDIPRSVHADAVQDDYHSDSVFSE